MPRPKNPIPSYLLHRPSGQARVIINGQTIYLGKYGSKESKEKYHRLLAEFPTPESRVLVIEDGEPVAVAVLAAKFVEYAKKEYRKNGEPTEELCRIWAAIRPLVELYGATPVAGFTPKNLKAVRERMISVGDQRYKADDEQSPAFRPRSRRYVNKLVTTIRQVFEWGVSEELVPVQVHQALQTVRGIRKNREPRLKEPTKVLPAPDAHIQAVLRHLPGYVQAMVKLQRLTGMRPDEVTVMRPCDVYMDDDVWEYQPSEHKLDWHEGEKGERTILLGPKAQLILRPLLDQCESEDYVFNPKRLAKGQRFQRDHHTAEWLSKTIRRVCEKAGVPPWTPNQVRHTAGTQVREEYDVEAAQLMLGHRNVSTTEIYAERSERKYKDLVRKIG
jgi:integrase